MRRARRTTPRRSDGDTFPQAHSARQRADGPVRGGRRLRLRVELRAPSAAAAKTYKDLTVGFIQTGSEGGWRAANTASFKDEAEKLGLNLKFYDAQNKMENQLTAFRQFIADDSVNVIVLAALEAAGWDDVLKEAKDEGQDRRPRGPPDRRPRGPLRHVHRLGLHR